MNWLTIIKNIMAKNKDSNSENNLPKELSAIKAVKPGSRNL